jgi:hypothetical protein
MSVLKGMRLYIPAKNGKVLGGFGNRHTQYLLFKYFRILYYIQNGPKVYVEQSELSKRQHGRPFYLSLSRIFSSCTTENPMLAIWARMGGVSIAIESMQQEVCVIYTI